MKKKSIEKNGGVCDQVNLRRKEGPKVILDRMYVELPDEKIYAYRYAFKIILELLDDFRNNSNLKTEVD